MTKSEIAKMIYHSFTTGHFSQKPPYEAIAEYLLRLHLDENPVAINYVNQYEIDSYLELTKTVRL